MERTQRFTLIALTTLFAVMLALLWAIAACESERTNNLPLSLGATCPNRSKVAGRAINLCAGFI